MRIEPKDEVTRNDVRVAGGLYMFIMVAAMTIIPIWWVRASVGIAWIAFTMEILIKCTFGDKDSIKKRDLN